MIIKHDIFNKRKIRITIMMYHCIWRTHVHSMLTISHNTEKHGMLKILVDMCFLSIFVEKLNNNIQYIKPICNYEVKQIFIDKSIHCKCQQEIVEE